MDKKYIVTLADEYALVHKLTVPVTINGKHTAWIQTDINLTPYTEPDMEQVRKEAYEDGYKTAKIQCSIQSEKDMREVGKRHYQRGLSDAWEAARKVTQVRKYGGYGDCLEEVFGRHRVPWDVFDYSASEAIEKIRQYEQKKEKIKIGDEVKNIQTGVKFTVTHLWENNRGEQGVSGFNQECSAFSALLNLVDKTGRHFPEVAAIFDKMRGE